MYVSVYGWDEKSCPLWRGGRYSEVAVSGGSTVVNTPVSIVCSHDLLFPRKLCFDRVFYPFFEMIRQLCG